ncbi:MAG: hypothetical protein RMJ84_06525, partial [Sandaracinaceae bacterium]|nr:hypothetical protein [Sandaracinaceae bacterium]
MADLTSILLRDQLIFPSLLREALARQSQVGGDITSALLELGSVSEDVLARAQASVYGLRPVSAREVMEAPREVIDLISREMAIAEKVLPISIEGEQVIVACNQPLSQEQRQRLESQLKRPVEVRIACEVRILAGLAKHHKFDLPPRFAKLLAKLDLGEPSYQPSHITQSPSPSIPGEQSENKASQLHVPLSSLFESRHSIRTLPYGFPVSKRSDLAHTPFLLQPSPTSESDAPLSTTSHEEAPTEILRPLRIRGPISFDQAIARLEASNNREEMLAIFFALARQFFDFVALFVIIENTIRLWDIWGEKPSARIGQSWPLPREPNSIFSQSIADGEMRIAFLSSPSDAKWAQLLGRKNGICTLLLPVSLRKRTVILLVGDRSGEEFSESDIHELLALQAPLAKALERWL